MSKIPTRKYRPFPLCTICPKCDSSNTEGIVDGTSGKVVHTITCKRCGYVWKEIIR
jgi:transcription elongation factor Elf1